MGLFVSSILAGLIATTIMVIFLYLPRLWQGDFFDVLGAIGSLFTGQVDGRSRALGAAIYYIFGVVFTLLYGLLALSVLRNEISLGMPELISLPGSDISINLFYPLLGLAMGLGHGVMVALLTTVLIENHPLERYRTRYILIISQLISHVVFGISVMVVLSYLLQR